jgi:pimeloyl-ACP methyl ester carboxylesterase
VVDVIHVFHGLFGSPDDFAVLARPGVRLHDLYAEDLSEIKSEIRPGDVLVGYSLGGRLALELTVSLGFIPKKVILLNAHPGLREEECPARIAWEDEVIRRLSGDNAGFSAWWNALPVFAADAPIEIDAEVQARSVALFQKLRLSGQPDFVPVLRAHADKFTWLIGESDHKYVALARECLIPAGIKVRFVPGGHRLHQSAEALKALEEELA